MSCLGVGQQEIPPTATITLPICHLYIWWITGISNVIEIILGIFGGMNFWNSLENEDDAHPRYYLISILCRLKMLLMRTYISIF